MELTATDKQKKRERERESNTWTTKICAMGWAVAVKHETSMHIDTPHV